MTVGSRESNCRAPIQGVPGSGCNIWNYTHKKRAPQRKRWGWFLAGPCALAIVYSES
jgi:hypothetical protein